MLDWVDAHGPTLEHVPGVRVLGEVDMATAPALQGALEAAVAASVGVFVLDLSETEFLDSSGIAVLLRTRALLGRTDRAFVVVCPEGAVRRVLEACGLADVFTMFATPEEAAAALVKASRA
jgi:anti-sigma B factor antagonist